MTKELKLNFTHEILFYIIVAEFFHFFLASGKWYTIRNPVFDRNLNVRKVSGMFGFCMCYLSPASLVCDPVLSVHSQCICRMEIVHRSCAVHRACCTCTVHAVYTQKFVRYIVQACITHAPFMQRTLIMYLYGAQNAWMIPTTWWYCKQTNF